MLLKYIKKNYIMIIYYLIIAIFFILNILYFLRYDNPDAYLNNEKDYYDTCIIYNNLDEKEKDQLIKDNYGIYIINDDFCNEIVKNNVKSGSFFVFYDKLINNNISIIIFPFFVPLLIIFPLIYKISKEFRSKYIKNYLQRNTYKSYLKHLFKESYKYIFIIPIILFLYFLIAVFISKFNFNPTVDIGLSYLSTKLSTLYNNWLFYLFYIVIIILNLGLYINISLIILSRNKKFFLSFAESFLIVYLLWCFSFIAVGLFFQNNFGIFAEEFNLLDIYNWSSITNMYVFIITNIIYYLISFIILIYRYKDKEKLIIMCER